MNRRMLIQIVWPASLLTKAIYLFIALKEGATATTQVSEMMVVLFVLGVVVSTTGVLLSRKMYRDAKLYDSVFLKRLLKRRSSGGLPTAEDVFFQLFVIVNGLFESAALFGLIGFMTVSNFQFLITMNLIALTGWAYHRPRYSRFLELIGKTDGGIR